MDGSRKRCLQVLALVSVVLSVLSNQASAEPIYQTYVHGMAMGNGHNLYAAENKLSCVSYQVVQSNPPGAIRSANWYWDLVESNQDLFERSAVNASASVSVGFAGGSAEVGMLQQNQLTAYDVNILGLVDVDLRWDYATQVQLKPQFQQMLVSNPEQFLEQCGNYYVSGVRYGGSFYNLITISTSSMSDWNQVSAKISGGFGPFSASTSTSNETMSTLSSRHATIKGYSTGSGGGSIPLNPGSMNTRVQGYPQEVLRSGGTMTGVILEEYPTASAGFDPKIWRMATTRWDFISIRREIEYAESKPGQFYMDLNSWRPRLAQLKNEANAAIGKLDQALQACRNNPDACSEPTGIRPAQSVRSDLPPRYAGECGTQEFDMRTNKMTSIHPLGGRCGGDTEMGGHNPSITVNSKFLSANGGKRINLYTDVKMKEGKKDWTCFSGSQTRTLLYDLNTIYPGCYLAGSLSSGSVSGRGGNDNHRWTWYTGSGILEKAECLSDTKGKDSGRLGCRKIVFRDKIPMTLKHDEDKRGPNVYRPAAGSGVSAVAKKVPRTMKPFANRITNIRNITRKNVQLPTMMLMQKPTQKLVPKAVPKKMVPAVPKTMVPAVPKTMAPQKSPNMMLPLQQK